MAGMLTNASGMHIITKILLSSPFHSGGAGNNRSAYGKVHTAKNLIIVVGCDGMARVFDARLALGTGSLCGSVLRSRVPKTQKPGSNVVPQSVAHTGMNPVHYMAATASSTTPSSPLHHHTALHSDRYSSQRMQSYMTHPSVTEDRPIQSRNSDWDGSVTSSSPTHRGPLDSNIDAAAGYDFILQDSQDPDDAKSRASSRRTALRSTSAGRAAPAGTFGASARSVGASTRASSVTHTRSVAGESQTSRRTSSGIGRDRAAGKVLQSFVATHKSRKDAVNSTAHLPLFELAALTPKENQVNVRKLKNFLDMHGKVLLALNNVKFNLCVTKIQPQENFQPVIAHSCGGSC